MAFKSGYYGGSLEASPLNTMIKMEPVSPASVSSTTSTTSSNTMSGTRRKRNSSEASLSSFGSGATKLKKYQMNPEDDPSVKNAIAAKHNREKKKREFESVKTRNQELERQNQELAQQLQVSQQRCQSLDEQLQNERKEVARCQELVKGWLEILNPASFQQPITLSTSPVHPTAMLQEAQDLPTLIPAQIPQEDLDVFLNYSSNSEWSPTAHYNDSSDNSMNEGLLDPLLSSIHKDEDLPSEPPGYEYDYGYPQHRESLKSREFAPPGG